MKPAFKFSHCIFLKENKKENKMEKMKKGVDNKVKM